MTGVAITGKKLRHLNTMTSEEKRVYILLKAIIFHYHGLEEREQTDLDAAVQRLQAQEELKWALEFIEKDHVTSFERARTYLNDIIGDYTREKRLELINMMWESNNLKGYVTEMEATAMIRLARDWNVEKDLVNLVLK